MAWQPPERGLSATIRDDFWKRVLVVEDHWHWRGAYTGNTRHGVLSIDHKYISAPRIAWALTHPGPVPGRLSHSKSCPHQDCVNPACWAPHAATIESARMIPMGQATFEAGGRDAPNSIGGVPVPPLLATLAHEQFDLDVVPVPRKFRSMDEVNARLAEIDGIHAPLQEVERADFVEPPPLGELRVLSQSTATVEKSESPVPLTLVPRHTGKSPAFASPYGKGVTAPAEKVLEALLTAGTACVTFPGGGVWIFGPHGARINEADSATAIKKFMAIMNRTRTDDI